LRPRRGATVSTPLKWEEVKKGLTPQLFTIYNMKERVTKTGDIFKGILGKGIDLHKCHMRLDA
jgi:bifunctional non-homologous end joining protein LigD